MNSLDFDRQLILASGYGDSAINVLASEQGKVLKSLHVVQARGLYQEWKSHKSRNVHGVLPERELERELQRENGYQIPIKPLHRPHTVLYCCMAHWPDL